MPSRYRYSKLLRRSPVIWGSFCLRKPRLVFWCGALAIGADVGSTVGSALGTSIALAAIHGMAGYFSGVVQAPMTALVIILEMTGDTQTVISIMAVSMIGYVTSRILSRKPLYHGLSQAFVAAAIRARRAARKELETTRTWFTRPTTMHDYLSDRYLLAANMTAPGQSAICSPGSTRINSDARPNGRGQIEVPLHRYGRARQATTPTNLEIALATRSGTTQVNQRSTQWRQRYD